MKLTQAECGNEDVGVTRTNNFLLHINITIFHHKFILDIFFIYSQSLLSKVLIKMPFYSRFAFLTYSNVEFGVDCIDFRKKTSQTPKKNALLLKTCQFFTKQWHIFSKSRMLFFYFFHSLFSIFICRH